jgi:hypothetical protein
MHCSNLFRSARTTREGIGDTNGVPIVDTNATREAGGPVAHLDQETMNNLDWDIASIEDVQPQSSGKLWMKTPNGLQISLSVEQLSVQAEAYLAKHAHSFDIRLLNLAVTVPFAKFFKNFQAAPSGELLTISLEAQRYKGIDE